MKILQIMPLTATGQEELPPLYFPRPTRLPMIAQNGPWIYGLALVEDDYGKTSVEFIVGDRDKGLSITSGFFSGHGEFTPDA